MVDKKITQKKKLVLMCEDCGKCQSFQGENADEIIQAIDNSGWEHSSVDTGLCPDCQEKEDQDLLGIPD